MAKREQPSSIDKLPPEIRELIATLRRDDGCTIDEIKAKLDELRVDVSRSALGRHVASLKDLRERMRHSRDVADALVGRFGDKPDSKVARANIELMQSIVMQTATAVEQGEDGDVQPITFDPENVLFLSRSLQSLASAEKLNSDRTLILRRELAKEAAQAVDRVAAKVPGGLSRQTVDDIKREILGVAA